MTPVHATAAPQAPAAQQASPSSSKRAGKTAPTFQEAVAILQEYWAKHGCIVWLPHNTEVRTLHMLLP